MCGNLGEIKNSVSRAKEVTWGLSIEIFYTQHVSLQRTTGHDYTHVLAIPQSHGELMALCWEYAFHKL